MSVYELKPFAGSSHVWAIERARAHRPGETVRLLDVGAATGAVGGAIAAARAGAVELTGVELDPAARAALAGRYVRAVATLDEVDATERFDLVLLLDVLEHTVDPAGLLAKARARVATDGVLLISVPNVAHWSVRLPLLFGRFDYADRGILDRTHVRFFTRRSILALLSEGGLVLSTTSASIVPFELLWPSLDKNLVWRGLRAARCGLARVLPGPFAFQVLAECRLK